MRYLGLHEKMPEKEYFAAEGMNASSLKKMGKSPFFYHFGKQQEHDTEKSEAMSLGSAAHCLILEGSKEYEKRYYVKLLNWSTKEGKAEKASLKGKSGIEVISKEQDLRSRTMLDALQRDHEVSQEAWGIIQTARYREVSLFHEFPEGIRKCRFDLLLPDAAVACDLKTADDPAPYAFSKTIHKFGYHVSAAWYMDIANAAGYPVEDFIYIVLGSKPPHEIWVYHLRHEAIEFGRRRYESYLERLEECSRTDEWPPTCGGATTIDIPAWAYTEEE